MTAQLVYVINDTSQVVRLLGGRRPQYCNVGLTNGDQASFLESSDLVQSQHCLVGHSINYSVANKFLSGASVTAWFGEFELMSSCYSRDVP